MVEQEKKRKKVQKPDVRAGTSHHELVRVSRRTALRGAGTRRRAARAGPTSPTPAERAGRGRGGRRRGRRGRTAQGAPRPTRSRARLVEDQIIAQTQYIDHHTDHMAEPARR